MAIAWTLRDARVTSADRRKQLRAARPQRRRAGGADFSGEELAAIDRHAVESGVNLWAASSSV